MGFGTTFVDNEKYYLSVTDSNFAQTLGRVRLLPDYDTFKLLPGMGEEERTKSRKYFLVTVEDVRWADDEYRRNVRYGLWSAWRRWASEQDVMQYLSAGTLMPQNQRILRAELKRVEIRGLGDEIESVVFAIKNDRIRTDEKFPNLKEYIKKVIGKYLPQSISIAKDQDSNFTNVNDPNYIDRLIYDFIGYWISEPLDGVQSIIARYEKANNEAYMRKGVLLDFKRFLRDRVRRRETEQRYGVYRQNLDDDSSDEAQIQNIRQESVTIANYEYSTFISQIFNIINEEAQRLFTQRQYLIFCAMLRRESVDYENVAQWRNQVSALIRERNLGGASRQTIYDEIQRIQKIIGGIVRQEHDPGRILSIIETDVSNEMITDCLCDEAKDSDWIEDICP